MSAPAFLFVAATLAAVRLCAPEPLVVHIWGVERRIKEFWRKLIRVSSLTGALLLVVVLAIWASAAAREAWNIRWKAYLIAYLCKRKPTANVGNSTLIFQLNQRELDQALYGPPVELHQVPKRDCNLRVIGRILIDGR